MIDVYMTAASKCVDALWMSGCGIILDYDDGQYQKHRVMGFGLDTADPSFSLAQAARLALTAIDAAFRYTPIIVHLPNYELLIQLADLTTCHAELLRRHNFFKDIGFLVELDDDMHMLKCKELAQEARDSQTTFDSLTTDGLYCE